MKAALVLGLLAITFSARADDAPKLPFNDWRTIVKDALNFGASEGFCDEANQKDHIVDYTISRKDGEWRIWASTNSAAGNRWVIALMDPFEFKPAWMYQGHTENGNDIVLEIVEPYEAEKHLNACPLIFKN